MRGVEATAHSRWMSPLRADQLQQILENACRAETRALALLDPEGNVQAEINRVDGTAASETPDCEASAPVRVNGSVVGVVRAGGPPEARLALHETVEAAASATATAWAAAQEIESLASELVHAYEELHLFYELGETLTGGLSAVAAAELILEKTLGTLHASWAELSLTSPHGQVRVRSVSEAGNGDNGTPTDEQRLITTLRCNGQVVGNIVLARPLDGEPFSSHDSKLLDAVGTLAGNAIRNAQLYEELHRRAEALRESEARLRAVMDNVADGIFTFDDDGIIQSFNAAAEEIFGYSAAEVVGANAGMLLPDPLARQGRAVLARYLRGEGARSSGSAPTETAGKRKDGTTFRMDMTVSEMKLGAQRVYIVSVRDVTKRKQAEETLRRTERLRALGQLASGVAHDLNQSLGLIAGYSDLAVQALDRPSFDVAELRKTLTLVAQAAMDGAQTVKRLLLFSRARPEGEREQVDVHTLLQDVAALTAPRWRDAAQMEGRHISMIVSVKGQLVISGWPSDLKEALTNLVLNSVDALPNGGTIQLIAGREGDWVHLYIKDDGVGMSPEVKARIFEPFFSTKGARGTGMGLAMVFGIIERHEGTVVVDSAPGQGTTFHITFPVAATSTATPPDRERVSTGSQRLRVLAVDDEPSIGQMVAGILKIDGHSVVTATSAEEALERLQQEQFDLVLSDLGLGAGMNGWDFAARVHKGWPRTRFVLATGWGAQIDPEEATIRGVDAVVAKPFRLTQLRQVVASPPTRS